MELTTTGSATASEEHSTSDSGAVESESAERVEADLEDAATDLADASLAEGLSGALAELETDVCGLIDVLTEKKSGVQRLRTVASGSLDLMRIVLTGESSVRDAAMIEILREPMMTERQADDALGAGAAAMSASECRERSWLLALPTHRGFLYPRFQFDIDAAAIYSAVRDVNERLEAVDDPWGVASWWFCLHLRLGARPADLIGVRDASDTGEGEGPTRDADVIAASKALLAPVG